LSKSSTEKVRNIEKVKGGPISPDDEVKGKKLRELRKHLDWTQEQLAQRLDLDPTYLSQLENGRRPVHSSYIERVEAIVRQLEHPGHVEIVDRLSDEERLYGSKIAAMPESPEKSAAKLMVDKFAAPPENGAHGEERIARRGK
jgi:transcriptional regulator with XRE-family HTH domain